MPASLFLKKFTLTAEAPRKGFVVVTAGTYDGRQGVRMPASPLDPVPFKRPRREAWTHTYEGDGLLIQHWPTEPDVFGYTLSITATNRRDKALEIAGKSTSAAGSVVHSVGVAPVGAVLNATEPILRAIGNMAGARTLASLHGSESDTSGTKSSWTVKREEEAVVFHLAYKVH